jgi:hypothetical protein
MVIKYIVKTKIDIVFDCLHEIGPFSNVLKNVFLHKTHFDWIWFGISLNQKHPYKSRGFLYMINFFFCRENDETVGIGEMDDRVSILKKNKIPCLRVEVEL